MYTEIYRLYEDGSITVCPSKKGQKKESLLKGKAAVELAKKEKSFEITSKKRRLIKCSAIRQALQAKNRLLFCTLTFPEKVEQKYSNQCLQKFLDNLIKNYNLNSYVIVKENTKIGTPHFHCIFDIPFIQYARINRAWCNTFSGVLPFSKNAFTTGRHPIINDPVMAAKYVTKYISKAEKGEGYKELIKTRCYFISRNVLSAPALISKKTFDYLIWWHKSYKKIEKDEFTIYFINNTSILPEDYLEKKKEKPPIIAKHIDYLQPSFNF